MVEKLDSLSMELIDGEDLASLPEWRWLIFVRVRRERYRALSVATFM
jgi:hypothetical protein